MSRATEMRRLTKDIEEAAEMRKSAIDAMRQATKSSLATFASMRTEMARDYRADMHKFLASLVHEVAAHRRTMSHQITQTRKILGAEARSVAAHRNATMNDIAKLGIARHKMGSRLRSNLHQQVDAVATQTAEVRAAARQAVSALANAHQKMATRQRAWLDAGRRQLTTDTNRLMTAIHRDRAKTHDIWSAFHFGGAA